MGIIMERERERERKRLVVLFGGDEGEGGY